MLKSNVSGVWPAVTEVNGGNVKVQCKCCILVSGIWGKGCFAGTGVQGWTRTACSRACSVLLSRLRRLLPGMQGFRLTGLPTGLLPLVAFCILKTVTSVCHTSYMPHFEARTRLRFSFSLLHHSVRYPISASLHCQLSGRQRRTAIHTSVNALKVSSHFLIAYDSCQRCTSAVALTYPAICCCLSAAT